MSTWTYNSALGILKRNGRVFVSLSWNGHSLPARKINILLAALNRPAAANKSPKQDKLNAAARELKGLIEGPGGRRWASKRSGILLQDIPAWTAFSNALTALDGTVCPWCVSAQGAPKQTRSGWWHDDRDTAENTALNHSPLLAQATTKQLQCDANRLVSEMLKRNPQMADHVGRELSLEEFALAVLLQQRAMTAGDNHSPAPSFFSPIPKVKGAAKRKPAGRGAGEHLGGDASGTKQRRSLSRNSEQPVIPSNPASRASPQTDTDEILDQWQEGMVRYVKPTKRNLRKLSNPKAWEYCNASGAAIWAAVDGMEKATRTKKRKRKEK